MNTFFSAYTWLSESLLTLNTVLNAPSPINLVRRPYLTCLKSQNFSSFFFLMTSWSEFTLKLLIETFNPAFSSLPAKPEVIFFNWVSFIYTTTHIDTSMIPPYTLMLYLLFFSLLKVLQPLLCFFRVSICQFVRPPWAQRELTWWWLILQPIVIIFPVGVVSGLTVVSLGINCSRNLFEMRRLNPV